jgi:hypothetical protein
MPDIIKPNLKALVWFAAGALLAPKLVAFVAGKLGR